MRVTSPRRQGAQRPERLFQGNRKRRSCAPTQRITADVAHYIFERAMRFGAGGDFHFFAAVVDSPAPVAITRRDQEHAARKHRTNKLDDSVSVAQRSTPAASLPAAGAGTSAAGSLLLCLTVAKATRLVRA